MAVFGIEREERRRKLEGFGGRYEVGDLGNVYSNGCRMNPVAGRYVNLSWKGHVTRADIGVLVARMFIPNPGARQFVVHKDGDWLNCRVENLEWSEWKRRDAHGRCVGVRDRRAVLQFTAGGDFVAKYSSLTDAAVRTGFARAGIKRVCDGEGRKCGGYIWRFE
jgi:hypothetical protein